MEGQVWVVLLMMPSKDPTLSQMNRQTCELQSHWDYSSPSPWLRDLKETLIEPSQCLETGQVTIIQDARVVTAEQ